MSAGAGYTPAVQAAWNQAGNANIARTGLTWPQVVEYIKNAPRGFGDWQDSGRHNVEIPGMGSFEVNYGPDGVTPISIVREGGGTDAGPGPDGGHYTDAMVGYGPGANGEIKPISYAINKSNGPLAAFIATILTAGAASEFLGPGAVAGEGAGEAALPASLEGVDAGAGLLPEYGTNAAYNAGIGLPETAASTAGLEGTGEFANESAKFVGQNSLNPGEFWNTQLPYTPTTGEIPVDGVNQLPNESNKLLAQNNATPGEFWGPTETGVTSPYQNETEKFIRQNNMAPGEFWNTNLPYTPTTTGVESGVPGSTASSAANTAAKTLLPKLASALLNGKSSPGTNSASGFGSSGGMFGGSAPANETPGMMVGQAAPVQNQQIAQALILGNPAQPQFNFGGYQQVPDAPPAQNPQLLALAKVLQGDSYNG